MKNRIDYLKSFTESEQYPQEAANTLISTYERLYKNETAYIPLDKALRMYENELITNYDYLSGCAEKCATLSGEQRETVDFIFVVLLTEHLKVLYDRRGLSKDMFGGVLQDLKAKLFECHDIRGVWGTFVTFWFDRFFLLTRFCFGRLQYEITAVSSDETACGYTVKSGDLAVNIHIPSSGPLDEAACRDSFLNAEKFFAPAFKDGLVPFRCGSWLLSPENYEILKPTSNILKFMNFFEIKPHEKTVDGDFWRIFGKKDCSDVASLPEDNSLRRAYKSAILSGNTPHLGIGLFFMQNGEFLAK